MKQLAAWYQKKISSYDKEEWEMMVEQLLMKGTYRRRIVDFSKQARSYLIDVDLVRGSSFPKAKPSLSVRRVVWFALARMVFFPFLYRWWSQQTSPACANLLLAVWTLQLITIVVYVISPVDIDASCWLVPLGLMIVLSVVHSQIVSTTELELARVRPHSTYRRKIPRHMRHARSECEAGGSAESAASSHTIAAKPAKFRRRQSRAHDAPAAAADTLRKRKKDTNKDIANKNLECPEKIKPLLKLKVKVKDSDDEDYMAWKKPEMHTPIVTFTPPPEDPMPSSSFEFRQSVLTKKRLESFNVRNDNDRARPRACFPDGDDGFESLNGNNSNGSDAENRPKEADILKRDEIPTNVKPKITPENDKPKDSAADNSEVSKSSANIFMKSDEDEVKTPEVDSEDGAAPTSPSRNAKRTGVRFRNSWVQEMIEHASSDEAAFTDQKQKISKDYQSSTSDGECSASAPSIALPSHHTMSDWIGQTTNSEESSYGSQTEDTRAEVEFRYSADSSWDPFVILNPTCDTVKCTMWERGETLRAELSAVDISWYVVARAERAGAADQGYLWAGLAMAAGVAALPPVAALIQVAQEQDTRSEEDLQSVSIFWYLPSLMINYSNGSLLALFCAAFGNNLWEISTNLLSCVLRLALGALVFFLLAVAERAYKQRFLYAKLFSHLTSARRARKSELPHFRLNTVRNIKTWLLARSYLRRRGPQRSVDVIVSAAFMLTLVLLACVSAQLLRESVTLERGWLLEAMVWACCLGVYLLRLLTLGTNVNRKYRGCLSAILTEQINLHLAIEQRPDSKDQLMLTNNVLKLAADLLKELDAPFKISGICANHYLYTITKVVILSALSGVLSEMLGFKLKLHKIKIK